MGFKDHFSRQAAAYSRYRPGYPDALIEWVAAQAPDRRLAMDCATGNGQAAVALARHFDAVVAVDGSVNQLRNAVPHPKVTYVAALVERMPLRARSVSLVAAAQALHWFDFDRYYEECRRVLVPGGVVAAWTYEKFRVDAAVDAVIEAFYAGTLVPFWPPERRYVEQRYRTVPFPWREVLVPSFELETTWDLDQAMGYLASWSAVQRYKDHEGRDPLLDLRPSLEAAWGGSGSRQLRWPIHLRVGRADVWRFDRPAP